MYDGSANGSGSIFADYRNSDDFSDRNTVLYGHHMKNGTMFNELTKYNKQEFYDSNPIMYLYTPEGDYLIELICGTVEDGDYEFVKFSFESEKEFFAYVGERRAYSTFESDVELMPDDRIISLCTCSYEWNNARYMLIGRLVPITEDG